MLARLDSNEKDVDCFYRGRSMGNGQIFLAAIRTRYGLDGRPCLLPPELETPVNVSCVV
jgi:hypothetical protein